MKCALLFTVCKYAIYANKNCVEKSEPLENSLDSPKIAQIANKKMVGKSIFTSFQGFAPFYFFNFIFLARCWRQLQKRQLQRTNTIPEKSSIIRVIVNYKGVNYNEQGVYTVFCSARFYHKINLAILMVFGVNLHHPSICTTCDT